MSLDIASMAFLRPRGRSAWAVPCVVAITTARVACSVAIALALAFALAECVEVVRLVLFCLGDLGLAALVERVQTRGILFLCPVLQRPVLGLVPALDVLADVVSAFLGQAKLH